MKLQYAITSPGCIHDYGEWDADNGYWLSDITGLHRRTFEIVGATVHGDHTIIIGPALTDEEIETMTDKKG